jgi:TonB family protein
MALIDRMDSSVSSAFLGSDCVGRIIDGRFALLRRFGGTDQSSVFFTEIQGDPAWTAAIKLIPADAVDAEGRIAQWEAAKSLSHPHLTRLLYAGRCEVDGEDLLYVVTEHAEEVLSEILPARPLTPAETREMLGPIVDALSYLHARNLVHGDLKPSNIMVVDGRLKLSIDGLRAAGEPGGPSRSPDKYAAPEIATDKVSPASDVWSLGVVLVEALTQQALAWDALSGGEPAVPASIPEPFFSLARECLRVDPVRRCTLNGVRAYLEPARAAGPTSAESAGKRTSGTPSLARAMIVAGAVVVVMIVALIISSHHGRPSSRAVPQRSAPAASAQPASRSPATQPQNAAMVKGAVAYQAMPDIPPSIRDTIHGHVKVGIRVRVDSEGNVANAAIESQGPSRYFAGRALQAARDWKFKPAQENGRAVASEWILHFHFGQSGTTIAPVETSP